MSIIQKISAPITQVPHFSNFTVLGDPGCDGLGAEVMSLYAQGLRDAQGAFVLVAGDLVPDGREAFYRQTDLLVERTAKVPVYMLRGNHDTGAYNDHYGLSAYAIHDEETMLVILDDALDKVTVESVALLEKAVQQATFRSLILAMHVPPPNSITKKAIVDKEWAKIRKVLVDNNCADKLRYVIAGHVHSYFEDGIDGAVTVVTGGAGARIAAMEGVKTPYNHYVEFQLQGEDWTHKPVNLSFANSPKGADEKLNSMTEAAFMGECRAFVRYSLLAEDAQERGLPNLSALYRAVAKAELHHARNFYYVNGNMQEPLTALQDSMAEESKEATQMYEAAHAYAAAQGEGLAASAFEDTKQVEQSHLELFTAAQTYVEQNKDIPAEKYYVCSSCGATYSAKKPGRCVICGAPADKIFPEP